MSDSGGRRDAGERFEGAEPLLDEGSGVRPLSVRPPSSARGMQGTFEVTKVREGSLTVRCLGADELANRRLLTWLSGRSEVMEIVTRAGREPEESALVDVRFRDRGLIKGAFARSLKDWVFAATRPTLRRVAVEVVHFLEGRVRLRIAHVSEDDVVRIAGFIAARPGVARANPSPAGRSLLIAFDPAIVDAETLIEAIEASDPSQWPEAPPQPARHELARTAFNTAVFAAAVSGVVPAAPMSAAVALTAIPSVKRTLKSLGERRLGVDLLDVVAIGISLGTGQPATAALITWLLGVGDVILARTSDTARGAIAKVLKLDAVDANLVTGGGVKRVSAKHLQAGDVIVVEAGGCVAADGVVVRGTAMVDEKALTGESMPRRKQEGERVLAASVVVEGEMFVEVERVGTDTTAAKIVQILEGAGAKPMTLQRDTEAVADRLVLPTFGVAAASAFVSGAITRATSVLITDFGTGIRIAVPVNALTGITLAARDGVLVKGGQYLERLAKVDTIVFDKTGTLTGGTPEVFEVATVGEHSKADVVRWAASVEARQRHPVAEAIRAYAAKARLDVPEEELGSNVYTVGFGVAARVEGHDVLVGGRRFLDARGVALGPAEEVLRRHREAGASSLVVAVDDVVAGVIGYADQPRAESRAVVERLKDGGRRQIVLMSGDARAPVEAVARAVGVDRSFAELLPEDKAARVRELQKEGRIVAMVGDGINDAPALAVADVGISLEGGTDVALETADVVLLEGGLARLPVAFDAGDRAMRRVHVGLGLVIVPNAAAILLGALGLITPGIAAIVNNGSTLVAALTGVAPLLSRSLQWGAGSRDSGQR